MDSKVLQNEIFTKNKSTPERIGMHVKKSFFYIIEMCYFLDIFFLSQMKIFFERIINIFN